MNKYSGIDYEQRPESYWDDHDVLSSLLRNVKGSERREIIRVYWEQGRLDELDEELLKDELDKEEREALGRIHPLFLGGEYLPAYKLGEVEIARIELNSTTADVIAVRARKSGRRIRYRIVDEYNSNFDQERQTSLRPLSLGELIRFFDKSDTANFPSGLGLGYNESNEDCLGLEELRDFTRISSQIYPDLALHYECVFDDWVAEGGHQNPRRKKRQLK